MGAELAKALAAFQKELPSVAKRATADTGSYKYDYAGLEDVSAVVLPLLGKHGLAFTAAPTFIDGRFVLAYALLHESGDERAYQYPLPDKGTSQQLGSAITYARRYALQSVTGVAPGGEDDDGQQAEEAPTVSARTGPSHTERVDNRPGADMWDEIRGEERRGSADPADLAAIKAAYSKLGFDQRTDALRMLHTSEQLVGHALSGPNKGKTHKNLTWHEAKKLRGELEGFKGDRGALLARLSGVTQAAEAMAAQDAAEGSQEPGA